MCVAIPCKVLSIDGYKAVVDAGGAQKEINTTLIDDLSAGDYVLVHAGFAIQKVLKEYAEETLELLKQTARLMETE
jgi:hydrogenase expression/formation protein HypC